MPDPTPVRQLCVLLRDGRVLTDDGGRLPSYVDDHPWVHIDIAGTAWGTSRSYVGKGASGFGTRLLIELARRTASVT